MVLFNYNVIKLPRDETLRSIKWHLTFLSCFYSLYDAATQQPIAHYEVQRILFYARGESSGLCAACFAFTWSHGDTLESAIYQCHVFRCNIPEAVSVSLCLIFLSIRIMCVIN